MNMKIKVTNTLTKEVVIDSILNFLVEDSMSDDAQYEIIKANHDCYTKQFPDCHVNFSWNDGQSFIFGVPYNMTQDEIAYDEGRITWKQYCDKWYKGCAIGGNEEFEFA